MLPDTVSLLQMIIITAVVFISGVLTGWWVTKRNSQKTEQRLLDELTGLRANYSYMREDAHELRVQLKQAKIQNARLMKMLESTSGHGRFLKVRTELETARKGIQALKAMLGRLENENFALKEKIYKYRQQKNTRSPLHPMSLNVKQLPALNDGNDDLKRIDGINRDVERKLHSMGIISYRQLAECTPAQLLSIQNLAGSEQSLPLRDWVKAARRLFLEKYDCSENDAHAFADKHFLKSGGSGTS